MAIFFILIGATGLFLFLQKKNSVVFSNPTTLWPAASSSREKIDKSGDETNFNKPLPNPPLTIKAIYFTSWSAGVDSRISYLIEIIKNTELNAAVIDIKDYSGFVAYDTKLTEVKNYRAEQIRIRDIDGLIKRLHNEGIYVIARILVFQDPVLARAREDLAIKNKSTGKLWLDNKNLAWMDPAAREVWDYNIAIAKEAAERGFDELNFDYIRFPSEGDLNN
ncbi:MAG: putative glycoside hydrolase, partial [bacterium]|nr:putative glycoside hydrolase [bacterium]